MQRLQKVKSSSLASGAGSYLIASVMSAAIPFLLLPVLTRYLEPAEYGEVAVFQVWVSLIGALCGLSVHGAAGRKYYDYEEPDKYIGEFLTACLVVLVGSSLLVLLLVAPFSGWLSGIIGLSEKWLYLGVFYAFFNFLIQLRLGQWQVRKEPKKYGAFQVSKSLLDMFLSLFLVAGIMLGVTGRLAGQTSATILFGMLGLLMLWRGGLLGMSWRPDLMREALRFGVPLVPHVVGAFLLITVDRAVISAQIGLQAAGYYMVAAQMAMVIGIGLDSVNKAYVPWLYERLKRDDSREKLFIVKLTYCYGIFLLLCAVAAFLVGGELLVFVAGEKYRPAAELIGWFVLAKAFHGMYYTVSSYIFYAKKTSVIAKITIFCGVMNVFMLLFLTREYGLVGAAWSMCISMLLQWLMTWKAASKLVKMPWILDWKL